MVGRFKIPDHWKIDLGTKLENRIKEAIRME